MDDILVSIVCIAYNHEKYIRDALEGILDQDVNFKYEIIVHDDASIDKTPQIIKEYEERYPEVIQAIYESENQFSLRGSMSITMDMLKMCRGKYIAWCECDDYWIDNHKLEIQIEWMENHPDYFMTAHNALRLDFKNNTLHTINPYSLEKEISPEELIMKHNGNIPTASMIMKADIKNMESIFLACEVGDIPMQFYSMSKGKIYYFDRIMSVYRYGHTGSWCVDTLNSGDKKVILHYAKMIRFAYQYDSYTRKKYSVFIHDLVLGYLFAIFSRCRDMTISTFRQNVKSLIDNSDESLEKYLYDIAEAFEQFYSEDYVSYKLKNYINGHQRVYIWGTGHYGTLLAKKFVLNKINYDGFIVSDEFEADQGYMDKPVYKISEMCHRAENMCIIAAMDKTLWKEIRKKLERCKITEYSYMICI